MKLTPEQTAALKLMVPIESPALVWLTVLGFLKIGISSASNRPTTALARGFVLQLTAQLKILGVPIPAELGMEQFDAENKNGN